MLLTRREPAYCFSNLLPCQLHRLVDSHALDDLSQGRAADKRGRAAISQETRRFDAAIGQAQTQTQAVATDRVGLRGSGVSIRELASVARIDEMVLKGI